MRGSGILLHISSLPGPHGIGTFGKEAYDFVDFLEKAKQKYWQILPLAPTSYGDSPYQTLSAFAGNPYFIDFETLKAEGLLEEGDLQGLPRRNTGKVDYGLQFRFRFGVLKKAYLRFREDGPFRKFSETHSWWLDDYALFMALKAKHGHVSWEFWPDAYKFREQKAMGEFRKRAADEIGFWKFIQYKFFQQWEKLKKYANGKGIKIIGDIPIYVAYDSADVWCQPGYWQLDDALVPKAVAGVPPDAFTPDGQLWGNPLYDYGAMEKDGFSWWLKRIKFSFLLYDILRIDHFRGFESYYAVPYGEKTARNGTWVKGPGIKLFSKIKEKLGDLAIIAEDLGYLTPEVRSLLRESGFPGMKIFQFGFNPDYESEYAPHNYTKNSVVYPGTHDSSTLRGWVKSRTRREYRYYREYLGFKRKKDAVWSGIAECFKSVCDTCIIQMQDYLELDDSARFNIPSTLGGNWIWRVKSKQLTEKLAKKIARLVKIYYR